MVRWWFSRYSTPGAKRVGRADGKRNIPAWDDPHQPAYVMEIVQLADENIRAIREAWHNADRVLEAKAQQLEEAIQNAEQQKQQAENDLNTAKNNYTRRCGEPPPAGGDTRLIWYWLLLLALFVFEFPINLVVFRLFGESELFTVIATAAIGTSLLVSAHYLGRIIKEGEWDGHRIFMAISLVAAPLLTVAAVAWLRQLYLSQVSPMPGTPQPAGMMYAFAAFNLMIFLVAVVAAYFVHDELLFKVYRARKQLAKAERKLLAAKQACVQARQRRKKQWEVAYAKAKQVKDIAQRLIFVYQGENLRVRPDREQNQNANSPRPKAFAPENQPKIAEKALGELKQAGEQLNKELGRDAGEDVKAESREVEEETARSDGAEKYNSARG